MARKKNGGKKPRKSVPRSTRRSRSAQAVIDDARDVLAAAKKNVKGFKKYDAKRKDKLLPPARIDAFGQQIRAMTLVVGSRRTRKAVTGGTTRREEAAREVVFTLVSEIRGIVSASVEDDPDMRKAFLVGKVLYSNSTPGLTEAAADIQTAGENDKFRDRAAALGISNKMIDSLIAARRALIAANAEQHAQMGERASVSTEESKALRALEKETAYIRKIANLAFKGSTKILAAFEPKTVKARARPRKAPPTQPQATE